jgi:16S rRNA (cytidine1402-2'-O)-methyltransferase
MFQETKRGTVTELANYFKVKGVKGEIVVVVGGVDSQQKEVDE